MRVDASYVDALAVCRRCDWRSGPYPDRTGARAALLAHTTAVHPREAKGQLAKARQRERVVRA